MKLQACETGCKFDTDCDTGLVCASNHREAVALTAVTSLKYQDPFPCDALYDGSNYNYCIDPTEYSYGVTDISKLRYKRVTLFNDRNAIKMFPDKFELDNEIKKFNFFEMSGTEFTFYDETGTLQKTKIICINVDGSIFFNEECKIWLEFEYDLYIPATSSKSSTILYKYNNQKQKSLIVDLHNMTNKNNNTHTLSLQWNFFSNGCIHEYHENLYFLDPSENYQSSFLCPFLAASEYIRELNQKLLGECAVDCDFDNDCQYGLVCADRYKSQLEDLGYDNRKAYCGNKVGKWNEEVCFNPRKIPNFTF